MHLLRERDCGRDDEKRNTDSKRGGVVMITSLSFAVLTVEAFTLTFFFEVRPVMRITPRAETSTQRSDEQVSWPQQPH